ncbi:hypothetical protein Plhal304r1_c047g0129111 [Plasmopara halstedii]
MQDRKNCGGTQDRDLTAEEKRDSWIEEVSPNISVVVLLMKMKWSGENS